MKLSMRLTLQGLIRALQGKVHDLAEEVERGRGREMATRRQVRPPRAKGGKHGVGRG